MITFVRKSVDDKMTNAVIDALASRCDYKISKPRNILVDKNFERITLLREPSIVFTTWKLRNGKWVNPSLGNASASYYTFNGLKNDIKCSAFYVSAADCPSLFKIIYDMLAMRNI